MPVAAVGDAAEATLDITAERIERYAAVTGDTNPIHLDEAYASETMLGGRVAHGMLTAGVVSAALARLPGDVIYLSQDCRFEAPVRPGDTVTVRVEVAERVGGDRLRVSTTATTDGSDETVLTGEAVVLSVPHGSADADAG